MHQNSEERNMEIYHADVIIKAWSIWFPSACFLHTMGILLLYFSSKTCHKRKLGILQCCILTQEIKNPAETVQAPLRIMAPILKAIMHFTDLRCWGWENEHHNLTKIKSTAFVTGKKMDTEKRGWTEMYRCGWFDSFFFFFSKPTLTLPSCKDKAGCIAAPLISFGLVSWWCWLDLLLEMSCL